MDTFAKIKKILEYGSGKAVVLDQNGNPEYIVISWHEYEKMLHTIDVLRGLPKQVFHNSDTKQQVAATLEDLPL